ncbi:hypothetical protein QJS10_CPB12g00527 [Acorus calamus]|uniref:Uncharacterized protein n=1 Tax=Acorus calamus TaxID=4465 RepID=A0AAV9DQ14_ACOCL|nr:hypothetical protein QJS10_CPB12g00527 [Acorus calamus]
MAIEDLADDKDVTGGVVGGTEGGAGGEVKDRGVSLVELEEGPHGMDSSKRYSYNPTLHWNPQVEEYFINAYGAEHFDRISKALT